MRHGERAINFATIVLGLALLRVTLSAGRRNFKHTCELKGRRGGHCLGKQLTWTIVPGWREPNLMMKVTMNVEVNREEKKNKFRGGARKEE